MRSSITLFLLVASVSVTTWAQGLPPSFQFGVGTHSSWSADALSGTKINSNYSQPANAPSPQNEPSFETAVSPPTRSSFIARWDGVRGAKGYWLDVSTDSSFNSDVVGYQTLDVGNVNNWVVTGLTHGTTYYYRVRTYDATGTIKYSKVSDVTTTTTAGMAINPTFDASVTNNVNSVAIQDMIIRCIGVYESLFSDPTTVSILFRYSTTEVNGNTISSGTLARSNYVYYTVAWNTYMNALKAEAKNSNDNSAIASLPVSSLSTNILPSSAGGRAIGLNTPPAMFADGSVASGGPYDGIVTLNSSQVWNFSRPSGSGSYDAQRSTEHEIDEVLGLGSYLGNGGSNLRPQDLYSWSSAGSRNITSSGTRFFSINGGNTNIVGFNQNSSGDYGDWLSGSCPQTDTYVQNAFSCPGQFSDVTAASPEGINLDVIGYDLEIAPTLLAPTLASPLNGATGVSTSPTLSWNPSTGATSYRLQVSTGSSFLSTVIDQSNITETSYNFSGLAGLTLYYWRVNASNGTTTTSFSAARNFTTQQISNLTSLALRYFDPSGAQKNFIVGKSPVDSGFVFGTNVYADQSKATAMVLPTGLTEALVSQIKVWFGYKRAGLTNQTYRIQIYDGTGVSGPVGEPLYSQEFLMTDILADAVLSTSEQPTVHTLAQQVTVGHQFFIAVDFGIYGSSDYGDLGIVSTVLQGFRVEEEWEKWNNGTWHNVSDAWEGGTNGWFDWVEATVLFGGSSGVAPSPVDVASKFHLEQNYPNPFNPSTNFSFDLPSRSFVSLKVFDLLGREIATLLSEQLSAGNHTYQWNPKNIPSGVYLYRLQSGAHSETRKLVLLK